MSSYRNPGPAAEEIARWRGPLVLEFGVEDCPYCQRARPLMAQALARYPGWPLVQVEDGRGRPLGRAFQVRQWPTFILLQDGREQARLVRPEALELILQAMERVSTLTEASQSPHE